MTIHGHVKNGKIVLDTPIPLPEGATLKIEVLQEHLDKNGDVSESLSALLLRHAGKGRDLPADLASHHDLYAHGKPLP